MTFVALAAGDAVFVDANIFVYHFAPDPVFRASCGQLLQRIENQEINGFTSTAILSEVAHRLMTIEARTVFGWSSGKVAFRLKQNPSAIQCLSGFRKSIEQIVQSRIRVLSIPPSFVVTAAGLSQQTGLLSNDALIVAVMQAHGLTNLASHDSDFDRVPGITRYGPA
jgi:predicted nucleic acid-binding protein